MGEDAERDQRRALDRRTFLKASALGAAAGASGAGLAWGSHHPAPSPLGGGDSHEEGGGGDEGDVPTPSSVPRDPGPTVKTIHLQGDAEITRYQANLDASDFGVTADVRTGLLYVTQRFTDNIVVFDRNEEKFVQILPVPTNVSGGHTAKMDAKHNSVWFAAGEASKIGRLVLDPRTLRPHNFVEYSEPGDVRVERKPHGLAVVDDEVWFTDDRQDRVGWLDIATGQVHVIEERIEADGINVEDRRPAVRAQNRRRRRRRRRRASRRRQPVFTGAASPRHEGILRIWIAGGSTLTGIDVRSRRIVYEVPIPQEPGVTQLRLHDVHYDGRRNRIWVLARGADHVYWVDADDPHKGVQGEANPGDIAAGLDHMDLGEKYVWYTEGRANNVSRYDPEAHETTAYKVPTPLGYFNPHGIEVVDAWKEVWFTERESICRLRFADGRAP